MGDIDKKKQKAAAKAAKKQAKACQKAAKAQVKSAAETNAPEKGDVEKSAQPSRAVRFAEGVRGVLFLVFAVSLVIGVILSQQGLIVTTSEIINSLISHIIGKIVLLVIAVAFFIYGLKYLRAIK